MSTLTDHSPASNYNNVCFGERSFDGYTTNNNLFNEDEDDDFRSFSYPETETADDFHKPHTIVTLQKGVSWQHRQKVIQSLIIEHQILSQADVLLSRSDLKSIAKITNATLQYRRDVLSRRMLYAECDGYCAVEQQDIVRAIQDKVFFEGGRFVVIEQHKETETLSFASRQQSFDIIIDHLTQPSHPFPSMDATLAVDDQVDLPKKMAAKKKKAEKEVKSKRKQSRSQETTTTRSDGKKKKARTTATASPEVALSTTGAVPDYASSQSSHGHGTNAGPTTTTYTRGDTTNAAFLRPIPTPSSSSVAFGTPTSLAQQQQQQFDSLALMLGNMEIS